MDDDTITVMTDSVEPQGSVAIGRGRLPQQRDAGGRFLPVRHVTFAGDWRPMRDLAEAIREGGPQPAEVPTWAIL